MRRNRQFKNPCRKVLIVLLGTLSLTTAQDPPAFGDAACPCLMGSEDGLPPIDGADLTDEVMQQLGSGTTNLETYGIGCARHDESTRQCTSNGGCTDTVVPKPVDCDRSWCNRSFCWVDPLNCSLLNRRSAFFPRSGRYYSYASCYDMDSFSQQNLLGSLNGRTLKVGFNSNSGGWTGAYSKDGQHFQGPMTKWAGPAVNFVIEAALQGGFQIELTEPPAFLRNKSLDFFSPSMFDYCVYATSLGYLDMCVADYTVTEERASSTDWLLLGTEPLYLIVQTDEGGQSKWDELISNVAMIFQPFSLSTWLFIILAVIPVLGILMFVHEYNHRGAIFPQSQAVMPDRSRTNNNNKSNSAARQQYQDRQPKERRIPFYQHVIKSIYITLLSTLHQTYEAPAVTYGAKIHLLGISFFILTIIAVYTANLAAILTQQSMVTTVNSLDDALSAGYRLCGERKNIEDLKYLYGIDDSVFVDDPMEEGGDGKPGFNCANCKSRARVFDFLDLGRAQNGQSQYCHAAVAPLQDLEVFQTTGGHCNKTNVGPPIRFVQSGFPVTESLSREVIAFLLKLKNDGVYDKELIADRPNSRCPEPEGGEGSALSIEQLMGIWVVTFAFALVGLFVTCLRPLFRRHAETRTKTQRYIQVRPKDQWGVRIDAEDLDDMPTSARLSPHSTSPQSVSQRFADGDKVGHNEALDSNGTEPAYDDSTSSIPNDPHEHIA